MNYKALLQAFGIVSAILLVIGLILYGLFKSIWVGILLLACIFVYLVADLYKTIVGDDDG